jgi:uncharacterized membrane protein YphA (DoxX/SURF4 family)
MTATEFYAQWGPRILILLRIVTALLFMEHGTQKLFSPLPIREHNRHFGDLRRNELQVGFRVGTGP